MSKSLKLFHKCFLHEKEMINEIIKYVGSTLLPLFYMTTRSLLKVKYVLLHFLILQFVTIFYALLAFDDKLHSSI